jgi:hypothetical protein
MIMTNSSTRTWLYYSFLAMLALSMVGVSTLRLSVTPAFACDGTLVLVDGHVECQLSGNNPGGSNGEDGGGGGGGNPGSPGDIDDDNTNENDSGDAVCTPGTHESDVIISYDPSAGMCEVLPSIVDNCTGEMVEPNADSTDLVECSEQSPPTPPNPCDEYIVTSAGVTCKSDFEDGTSFPGSEWQLSVTTPWPGTEIHTRPYPVTLVNWDTVMRVMGLGTSSKAGHLAYAAWGGGNEGSPAAGDWKDVTLRLEIKPVADWADVFLENIGLIRMRIGELHTFQWNLPSHPAAGGGPLSGQVGQLEELEPDVPLYTNWTRAPYMVYCTISYYQWEGACVNGPDDDGSTNCRRDSNGVFTGHREWGWKRHSQTVAITPQMAANQIAVSQLADLNGDGIFDAYWGRLSFIRRMDDAGNVNNPEWAHSYGWGPVWYWAVREAQGQIGWPGIPAP